MSSLFCFYYFSNLESSCADLLQYGVAQLSTKRSLKHEAHLSVCQAVSEVEGLHSLDVNTAANFTLICV